MSFKQSHLENGLEFKNRFDALHSLVNHLYTLLGPHSSDKLCIRYENRNQNHFLITNDGATLLSTLPLSGVSNDVIVRLSQIQDELIGDGTTSVVLLCHAILFEMNNNLLMKSGAFVSKDLFLMMQQVTWKLAKEMIEELMEPFDIQRNIPTIVKTCLSSKIIHGTKMIDMLTEIFLNSETRPRDRSNISIVTQIGKSIDESSWFQGDIIQKEWPRNLTWDSLDSRGGLATPLVFVCRLERLESFRVVEAQVQSSSVDESLDMLDFEGKQTLDIVTLLINARVKVIFQSGRISAEAKQMLEDHEILFFEGCSLREINRIASLCRTSVVKHTPRSKDSLQCGTATWIGPCSIHERRLVKIESSTRTTVLLNAPTFSMSAEAERSLHDAFCIVFKSYECGFVVPGAGALYIELSHRLRCHALKSSNDDIVVAESIARALESIPAILAKNASISVTDSINELRENHSKGKWYMGIVNGECPADARNALEPANLFLNILRGTLRSAYVLLFENVASEQYRENIRDMGLI